MKKLLLIWIPFLIYTSVNAQEGPEMESYTLKNGLKIYLIKYGKIEAVNVRVVINSGKKNETPGQQGYNSIVAGLVLKGNQKYTEEEQNDKAFEFGCEIQNSVDYDYTSISANFLTKNTKTVFDLMSAAILTPTFEKEKVDQYLSYLSSYNTPSKRDINDLTQIYSRLCIHGIDNPLGRSIYKQQLKTITVEKLKTFHQFNYTPKNTRIIVCGNFNAIEIKTYLENYFGAWQSSYGEVNGVSLESPSIKKKEIYFVNRLGATQCALKWNKIGPALNDKDALAFTIANALFNQVLFKEIREKGGKTYGIGSNLNATKFSNVFSIDCSVRSEEMLNTLNLFDKVLSDFSLGNFTKEEFDIEITKYKTDLFMNEYPEELVNFYNPVIYDFNKRKTILTELTKLTPEDIKKVIKKYFTPTIYKLVIAGDELLVANQLTQLKELKKLSATDLEYKTE
jgi:zinc protease